MSLLFGVKCLGNVEQLLVERCKLATGNRGTQHGVVRLFDHLLVGQIIELGGKVFLDPLVRVSDACVHRLGLRVDVLRLDQTLGHELVGEDLTDGWMCANLLVHEGLRVRRFIGLVMAEAAVADQVHHHVAAIRAAVVVRERDRSQARLDVVGVDVNDGDVEALGQVRRVARRPALVRVGGETYLVVGDEVHCATGCVAGERLQVKHLLHHTLAGERRIAVDQHGQCRHGIEVQRRRATLGLRGTAPTLDNWVDRLQVAGVGQQANQDDLARFRVIRAGCADVVLHVAGCVETGDLSPCRRELERVEDQLVGVIGDVRDDREPSAVGHSQDRLTNAIVRDHGHERLEHGHEGIESFDGEGLLSEECRALVSLHRVDLGEALEKTQPVLDGELRPVLAGFDVLAQPHALLMARDVLDLERDGAAVRAPEIRQHLGEVAARDVDAQQVRRDLLHQVLGETIGGRIHRGIADWRRPERVEVRSEMAVGAVRLDE